MKAAFRNFMLSLALVTSPVMALASSDDASIGTLASQIESLQAEVDRLRESVDALMEIRPTVTMLMPDFSERFHVMHYAADAEDWALASHELLGMKSLVKFMQQIDPEKGAMANGFLLGNFNALEAAIEHENLDDFTHALEATVKSCNACHTAVGSPSMKITLDARESLSMRHSHDLGKSSKPGDHMHEH